MTNFGDCVVCGVSTHLFKYGKYLCNSCDLFFRRSMTPWSFFGDCKHNWDCYKESSNRQRLPKCRHCRFNKCVDVGLLTVSRYTKLADLVEYLSLLDANREKTFLKLSISTDFDTNTFLDENPIRFIKKTSDLNFDCDEWQIMNKLSTIEMLKNLDFPKYLSSQDLRYFLKKGYFLKGILTMAMRSYLNQEEFMSFPNGVDLFPDHAREGLHINISFLNLIRCQLVGKFIELKITREEISMLGAIAVSNPAVPDLSSNGQKLLSCYQQLYTSSLLQYCLAKYQQNGPARFCNIMSVLNVANQTYDNIIKYVCLCQYYHSDMQPSKLYQSVLNQLN